MADQLPARAADIGNTVIYVLSGHIPSWEAIRDLVLPELQKVRQEALEEAAQAVETTLAFHIKPTMEELRVGIAQNIRELMEK